VNPFRSPGCFRTRIRRGHRGKDKVGGRRVKHGMHVAFGDCGQGPVNGKGCFLSCPGIDIQEGFLITCWLCMTVTVVR